MCITVSLPYLLHLYLTYHCIHTFPLRVGCEASATALNEPYLLVFMPLCHPLPLSALARINDLSPTNNICQKWWGWDDKKGNLLEWNLVYTNLTKLSRLTVLAIHDIMYPWYDAMERANHFCVIFPIMQNFSVIMKKYQTNTNLGAFYKKTTSSSKKCQDHATQEKNDHRSRRLRRHDN